MQGKLGVGGRPMRLDGRFASTAARRFGKLPSKITSARTPFTYSAFTYSSMLFLLDLLRSARNGSRQLGATAEAGLVHHLDHSTRQRPELAIRVERVSSGGQTANHGPAIDAHVTGSKPAI